VKRRVVGAERSPGRREEGRKEAEVELRE